MYNKICSTFFDEMKTKITMRYCDIPIQMANIK